MHQATLGVDVCVAKLEALPTCNSVTNGYRNSYTIDRTLQQTGSTPLDTYDFSI